MARSPFTLRELYPDQRVALADGPAGPHLLVDAALGPDALNRVLCYWRDLGVGAYSPVRDWDALVARETETASRPAPPSGPGPPNLDARPPAAGPPPTDPDPPPTGALTSQEAAAALRISRWTLDQVRKAAPNGLPGAPWASGAGTRHTHWRYPSDLDQLRAWHAAATEAIRQPAAVAPHRTPARPGPRPAGSKRKSGPAKSGPAKSGPAKPAGPKKRRKRSMRAIREDSGG